MASKDSKVRKLVGWFACQLELHKWRVYSYLDEPDLARTYLYGKCERCGYRATETRSWT